MNKNKYCGIYWFMWRLENSAYYRRDTCGVDNECDIECDCGICWLCRCSICIRLDYSCKFMFVGFLGWRQNLLSMNFKYKHKYDGICCDSVLCSNRLFSLSNGIYDDQNAKYTYKWIQYQLDSTETWLIVEKLCSYEVLGCMKLSAKIERCFSTAFSVQTVSCDFPKLVLITRMQNSRPNVSTATFLSHKLYSWEKSYALLKFFVEGKISAHIWWNLSWSYFIFKRTLVII